MSQKNIPLKLKEKQEQAKLKTLNIIQDAINDIKEDGGIVTKKRLIELTGLSSATFSKPHVKELLKVNAVCQFKNRKELEQDSDNIIIDQLYKTIDKLKNENNLLLTKLNNKDITISKLKKDYSELQENYERILGKIHIIITKIDERGIDIGIDFNNL